MGRRTKNIVEQQNTDKVIRHITKIHPGGLTVKQQRFCEEYVIDWNASRAARAVGYPEHEAGYQGHALLKNPKIISQIEKIKDKLSELSNVTALRNIIELRKIAYGNAAQFYTDWDEMRPWKELSDDEKAAISEIKTETTTRKVGKDGTITIRNQQVKLQDKIKAIEVLNKMLGFNAAEKLEHKMSPDSLRIGLNAVPLDDLSDEELRVFLKVSNLIQERKRQDNKPNETEIE